MMPGNGKRPPSPAKIAELQAENMRQLLEMVKADDERVAAGRPQPRPIPSVAWLCGRHPLLGGEYYRALRPAAFSNHRWGWGTAVCDRMATSEGRQLSFITPNDYVITPDVIILRPINNWTMDWLDRAHAAGQKVIADIDDDLWSHQDWTPDTRPNDDHYDDWCWHVDGWLVSTPYLAERVRAEHERRGEKEPTIFVAPNCYDYYGLAQTRDLDIKPGRTLGNRLWLSGRMNADLEIWQSDVAPLLDEMNLRFVHVGEDEDEKTTHLRDWGFPADRLETRRSVVLPHLGKAMEGVSIGVIVQGKHPYNDAKTETNGVELASLGLPLVAHTDHVLYENAPGLVPLSAGKAGVAERIEALLDPDIWALESLASKTWAKKTAERSEAAYLESLQKLVHLIMS